MPTLDPSLFEVVRNVPVVDSFHLQRDGASFKFDDAYLNDLVNNHYKLEKETGDLPVIRIGHDRPVADYEDKALGFIRAPRVQPLGQTGRNAIHADLWVYKEHAKDLKDFPRRSAEIFWGQKRLEAVALLGATAPERNLGLVALSNNSDIKLSREIPPMPDATLPPTTDGKEKQFAGLEAKIDQLISLVTKLTGGEGAPDGDGDEGAAGADNDPAALDKLIAEMEAEGAGPPSDPEPKKDDKDVKLAREVAKLKSDLATRDTRDALKALQEKGYQLNVEEELKFLISLDPDTRKLSLSRIEKNYPKAPVGTAPLEGLADAKTGSTAKVLTEENRKKINAEIVKLRREGKSPVYNDVFFEVCGFSPNELA